MNLFITGLNASWGLALETAEQEQLGHQAGLVLISAAANLLCSITQGTSRL